MVFLRCSDAGRTLSAPALRGAVGEAGAKRRRRRGRMRLATTGANVVDPLPTLGFHGAEPGRERKGEISAGQRAIPATCG